MTRYKKLSESFVSVDDSDLESSPNFIGDAHRIDEQLLCVIGTIMDAQRDRHYTEFKILVYGKRMEE